MKKPVKKADAEKASPASKKAASPADVFEPIEPPPQTETKSIKVNEKKWGKRLLKGKYTLIPNIIFERQLALKLDPVDINIILHLASYWWTAEGKPRPAKATIAEAMKRNPRTIQRHIERMEKLGYIRRERRFVQGFGSAPNVYHLDGLIAAATPYADEKVKMLAAKRAAKEAGVGRRGKAQVEVADPFA
jgi:hypothetical protein